MMKPRTLLSGYSFRQRVDLLLGHAAVLSPAAGPEDADGAVNTTHQAVVVFALAAVIAKVARTGEGKK